MKEASAADLIASLSLEPHPEGGWFRETWRAEAAPGERASATAIYFLLDAADRSHWHRVDAAELWLWHAGASLNLSLAASDGEETRRLTLGPDVPGGQSPQAIVPAGWWQSAEPLGGWVLVSCVVSPAFVFTASNWRRLAGLRLKSDRTPRPSASARWRSASGHR